jgi:hypothetical protein
VRTIRVAVLLLLSVVLIPDKTLSQPAGPFGYSPDFEINDLIPTALEVYRSSDALTAEAAGDLSTMLSAGSPEVLVHPSVTGIGESDASGSGGRSKYWPVLFSALMPGVGELTLGYKWRGATLIALEVAAWTGYFYYRNEGLDSRAAYESFADTHWDFRKWIDHHPDVYDETGVTLEQLEEIGSGKSGSQDWPGYSPWVSREEDKQHYYENIGKYDWYISGWGDFDPETQPWMTNTALRDQYRSLRKESNDQLDDANKFIYVSLGVRVFSIVETLFLVRSSDSSGQEVDGDSAGLSQVRFKARPKGFKGAEIALEYRF